eukprot:scaffold1913_cov257-Pinguiococcus_pyrenoidosus.AAC.17
MTCFTIFALYGDDVRIAAFERQADFTFLILTLVAFILFAAEIILSVAAKPGYFHFSCNRETLMSKEWYTAFKIGSFYFALDLIATLSLVLDISWFVGEEQKEELFSGELGSDGTSARAGRASKAGARASRVLRIVRMVRLVRLGKLYKYYSDTHRATASQKGEDTQKALSDTRGIAEPFSVYSPQLEDKEPESDGDDPGSESKIGAAMSDETTRRVIVIVLLILVLTPVLIYDVNEADFSYDYAANMLFAYYQQLLDDPLSMSVIFGSFLESAGSSRLLQLTFLKADGGGRLGVDQNYTLQVTGDQDGFLREDRMEGLRYREIDRTYVGSDDLGVSIFIDNRRATREAAAFGILLTSTIVLLLGLGAYTFARDVNQLVIFPIERMVELVNTISANPLGFDYSKGIGDRSQDGMETTILISTITKIGGLVRVGFGEAGADIIAENLKQSTTNSLNLLSSGRKITSIFGFCDIRQFTDTTECLQEEVMLFVNRIAEVVHNIVVQCGGAPNKNIGDAFLLTWKLDLSNQKACADLADRALLAFCKILAEMVRRQESICRFSVAATQQLLSRMPGYKVRMGNGLHVGWAIEGAIGSDRKIDASYISPHVNWAEYLEATTKRYGVPILMSESFFKTMSPQARHWCRPVDVVRRAPAEGKVALYTYECDLTSNFSKAARRPPPPKRMRTQRLLRQTRAAADQFLELTGTTSRNKGSAAESIRRLGRAIGLELDGRQMAPEHAEIVRLPKYDPSTWERDLDLILLRRRLTADSMMLWAQAVDYYIRGDWAAAQQEIQLCLRKKPLDGPALAMLAYMESQSMSGGGGRFVAPDEWDGCRNEF